MNSTAEIRSLLNKYFDTLYYCNLEFFDIVFHPQAIYASSDEVPTLIRNMTEYRNVIAMREPPAQRNEPRKDVINNIELAGSNVARARVQCSIGDRDFVDFLTLVRENEKWSIIAKVFHIAKTGIN